MLMLRYSKAVAYSQHVCTVQSPVRRTRIILHHFDRINRSVAAGLVEEEGDVECSNKRDVASQLSKREASVARFPSSRRGLATMAPPSFRMVNTVTLCSIYYRIVGKKQVVIYLD